MTNNPLPVDGNQQSYQDWLEELKESDAAMHERWTKFEDEQRQEQTMEKDRWIDLDLETVGEHLVTAVLASLHLRHKNPRSTARDYLHPKTPEGYFVRDVLSGEQTEALAERWLGGTDSALNLAARILSKDVLDD